MRWIHDYCLFVGDTKQFPPLVLVRSQHCPMRPLALSEEQDSSSVWKNRIVSRPLFFVDNVVLECALQSVLETSSTAVTLKTRALMDRTHWAFKARVNQHRGRHFVRTPSSQEGTVSFLMCACCWPAHDTFLDCLSCPLVPYTVSVTLVGYRQHAGPDVIETLPTRLRNRGFLGRRLHTHHL